MRKQAPTFEHIIYLLIFILALGVRVVAVNRLPLSDAEAEQAMRAVAVAKGEPADLGTQPAYVLLTGLTFFLTGSSETTARLWPVLMGSLLILVPFLLRKRLGQKAALVVALGLALDPGLIALSKTAGGPVMAVSLVLLAGVAWLEGGAILAGILTGLALMSGPQMWAGVIGVASALGVSRLLGLFPADEGELFGESVPAETSAGVDVPKNSPLRTGLLAMGGTLLLAGTLFLRYPQGLSAFASAMPAYLEGWTVPSGVSVLRLLFTFFVYPLPAIIFGFLAVVRGWTSFDERAPMSRALSVWLLIALIFALAYPGRQVEDLVWALIPLWGLAGLELSRYLSAARGDVVPWALAALVTVMLLSVWTNLGGLAASGAEGQMLTLRWLVVGGALLLAVLSSVLVGLGWSVEAAQRGLAWGTALALGVGMLASVWGKVEHQFTTSEDLWRPTPGPGQQNLLVQTLSDLGDWNTGRPDSLEVVSLVDTPSVRWTLRAMPNVRFQTTLNRDEMPDAILTMQDQEQLSLGSAYRGQDFVWWVYPEWDVWTGREWLKWLAFHQGGATQQNVILWARGDMFPSGEAVTDQGFAPEIDLTGASDAEPFVPDDEIFNNREEPLK